MKREMGLFITFEGIEGCGKSTQAKLLAEYLANAGYQVLLTREPGGPAISEKIRQLLLDPENSAMLPETEMLLYMASRSQHTGQWIIPALDAGKIVICDRYYDSSIAYQGAARELDYQIIDTLTSFATYNTEPDLTFLLDMDVSEGRKRIVSRNLDRLEMENIEFHQKVREHYLLIAENHAYRYHVINGDQTKENIRNIILAKVMQSLSNKG